MRLLPRLVAALAVLSGACAAMAAPVLAPAAGAPLSLAAEGKSAVTLQNLRALPPNTPVRTRGGRVVTAGQMLAVTDAMRKAVARKREAGPTGFSRTQAAPAVVLARGAYLPAVMSRPATDVVQLPNGQKMTVGDLKKIDAVMQRWKGRSMAQLPSARSNLAGPAVRVNSAHDLAALKNKPDSTVLENSHGVRVTLGELRTKAKGAKTLPAKRG